MVTELELTGRGFGAGQTYMLRYHKTASINGNGFEITIPEAASASWSGFRYRNNEVSVLLLRQGRSSAAA